MFNINIRFDERVIFLKKFKVILTFAIILVVGIGIGIAGYSYLEEKNNEKNISTSANQNPVYERIKANGNVIKKSLKNERLDPLITIAEKHNKFTIQLDGIKDKKKVTLVNTYTGEMMEFKNEGDGKISLDTKLEVGKDYGILIDDTLAGSIKVIESFKGVNMEDLYNQSLRSISCGL